MSISPIPTCKPGLPPTLRYSAFSSTGKLTRCLSVSRWEELHSSSGGERDPLKTDSQTDPPMRTPHLPVTCRSHLSRARQFETSPFQTRLDPSERRILREKDQKIFSQSSRNRKPENAIYVVWSGIAVPASGLTHGSISKARTCVPEIGSPSS